MSDREAIEITKVQIEPHPGLTGAYIDLPRPGDTYDSYALHIQGWALGADGPVDRVEVVVAAREASIDVHLGMDRPDVANQFPDVAHADASGFRTAVGVFENRANFGMELRAKLTDGSHARIAWIEGRRRPLRTAATPSLQPLMVSTIGRSGSTWIAWLLSCHSEIVGYHPLRFETRVGTYWMSVLQALAQPRSFLSQLVTSNLESDRRWWLGDGVKVPPQIDDPSIEGWLGVEAVEEVAAMCQGRIDAFFRKAAADQGKPGARYFMEKFLLDPVMLDLLDEIYEQPREIILVRDFRDVVSSVLAFNRKRGFQAFGREHVSSDEEYIRLVARTQAQGMLQRLQDRGDVAHVVRYEDLVLDPSPTLARILRYVGVDASEEAVQATLARATSTGSSMDHHRTVKDPAATIGRWREDLSEDSIAACEAALGPALEAFGYETAGSHAATDAR